MRKTRDSCRYGIRLHHVDGGGLQNGICRQSHTLAEAHIKVQDSQKKGAGRLYDDPHTPSSGDSMGCPARKRQTRKDPSEFKKSGRREVYMGTIHDYISKTECLIRLRNIARVEISIGGCH